MPEKKKILVSIANERGQYLPMLEVELSAKTTQELLRSLKKAEAEKEEGPEPEPAMPADPGAPATEAETPEGEPKDEGQV